MTYVAVAFDRVDKRYGRTVALRRLSGAIGRGEMFGLIGPDGAGKTTTMRLVCGLIRPDAGTVRVLGRDPVRDHRAITGAVGYLSQRFSLYGDLSIDENLAFFAENPRVFRDYRRGETGCSSHASHPIPRAPCRPALRRHETEARPRMHPHP